MGRRWRHSNWWSRGGFDFEFGGGGWKSGKSKKKAAYKRAFDFIPDFENVLPLFNLPSFSSQARNQTFGAFDDPIAVDELDNEVLYGTLRGDIVGLQYYKGSVNNHEMVSLVRQPNNQYDANAVKVDNILGEQVGHIKRELAKPLAFIMDNKLARIDGLVPRGANNTYSMPVDLTFWGPPENKATTVQKLKQHGYILMEGLTEMPGSSVGSSYGMNSSGLGMYAAVPARRTHLSQTEMSGRINLAFQASNQRQCGRSRPQSVIDQVGTNLYSSVNRELLGIKSELDKLFERLDTGDKTSEATPCAAIATTMFPHQRQALGWMMRAENDDKLPPFWEPRGTNFYNIVTNFGSKTKPRGIRGGILADDMGLGKTLEIIALVLTNFQGGLPLAVPVPGKIRMSKKAKQERLKVYRSTTGNDMDDDVDCEMSKLSSDVSSKKSKLNSSKSRGKSSRKSSAKSSAASTPLPSLPDDFKADDEASRCSGFSLGSTVEVIPGPVDIASCASVDVVYFPEVTAEVEVEAVLQEQDVNEIPSGLVTVPMKQPAKNSFPENEENDGAIDSKDDPDYIKSKNKGKSKTVAQTTVVPSPNVLSRPKRTIRKLANYRDDEDEDDDGCAQAKKRKRLKNADDECAKAKKFKQSVSESAPGKKTIYIKPVGKGRGKKVVDSLPIVGSVPVVVSVPTVSSVPVVGSVPMVGSVPTVGSVLTVSSVPVVGSVPIISRVPIVSNVPVVLPKVSAVKVEPCATKAVPATGPVSSLPSFQSSVASCSSKSLLPSCSSQSVASSDDGSDSDYLPDLEELPDPKTSGKSKFGKSTGRTKGKGPRATLIVCPLSALSNWLDQLEEHVDERVLLEVFTYYGSARSQEDSKTLSDQDIVLTTYQTLAADVKGQNQLQKVHWLRIVLDEGHTIRNPAAQMTKAIMEMKAERKWIVTGTPIQNSIRDLWTLVKFLGVEPFQEKQWWDRTIARPLAQGDEKVVKRVQCLLGNLALRRMKSQLKDGKPLVELPSRDVFVEHIKLSDEERRVYDTMQNEGKLLVSKYFNTNQLLNHYGDVLAIMMRLRQMCCHPMLIAKVAEAMKELTDTSKPTDDAEKKALIEKILMVLNSGSDEECAICLEQLKTPVITSCAHLFCRPCIEAVINTEKPSAKCPMCRGQISIEKLVEVPPNYRSKEEEIEVTDQSWHSSSKVDALMTALIQLRGEDRSIRSLVVSQFTSFLNLIEVPLRQHGFHFVRLDGTMSGKQRIAAIEAFSDKDPSAPTIFLLSLKAGGVGINLTAACRVFLMDPAWNPASEEQCFDRCHRLGQTRPVVVTKYIVENSVEERMMELQEKKRKLAQGVFGGGAEKQTAEQKRQQRINDIKSLMDLN